MERPTAKGDIQRSRQSIPHVCSAVRLLAGRPTQSPAESRPSDNQDVVPMMEPVNSLRSTFAMPTIALPPAPPLLPRPPVPAPPRRPALQRCCRRRDRPEYHHHHHTAAITAAAALATANRAGIGDLERACGCRERGPARSTGAARLIVTRQRERRRGRAAIAAGPRRAIGAGEDARNLESGFRAHREGAALKVGDL